MSYANPRDVLLSVKPQYANLLVDGHKTIELRRKFPVGVPSGTRCLIYACSPIKLVIGECKIDEVKHLPLDDLWREAAISAAIPWGDFKQYFAGLDYGYAIKVYGYLRYEKPINLSVLSGIEMRAPQSFRYLQNPTPLLGL